MKVNLRFMACLQAYSYLDWFQWTYSQNLSDYLEKFFDDVESKCVDEYHLNIL